MHVAHRLFLLSCYFEIRLKLWRYKTMQVKCNLLATNLILFDLYELALIRQPLDPPFQQHILLCIRWYRKK